MQQSELIDKTIDYLRQKYKENPLISTHELPLLFCIMQQVYYPDKIDETLLDTDDALQVWYKKYGYRTEFLVHTECFHPNWARFLYCEHTSIMELIFMLEEFKKYNERNN